MSTQQMTVGGWKVSLTPRGRRRGPYNVTRGVKDFISTRPPFTHPLDRAMLECLALGYTVEEAAEPAGYISGSAVKNRLMRLYDISGMCNIASLIAWCFRHGYLT